MQSNAVNVTTDLRPVAMFEALKGLLVLVAGFGVLSLVHHDIQSVAEELVAHLHLNPAKHWPQVFIHLAANVTSRELWGLALLAMLYASLRFVEAYGLWRNQRWAEWFAIVSGGIYIPFEFASLMEGFAWLKLITFAVNGGIVAVIAHALWQRKYAVARAKEE